MADGITTLAIIAPFILLIAGALATSWLTLKGIDWDGVSEQERFGYNAIKFFSACGPLVGIACIITAVATWITPSTAFTLIIPPVWLGDVATIVLLVAIGIAQILKPIVKFPWAALVGLIGGLIGVGAVILIFNYFSISLTGYWWVLGVAFVVVGALFYWPFKWFEDTLKLISMVLGNPVISTILGILAIAQFILLVFVGISLSIIPSLL